MIPTGYAQFSIVWTDETIDGEAHNVLGCRLDIVATPDAIATAILGHVDDNLRPQVSAALTLDRVDVKFGPDDTGPSGTAAGGLNGGIAGNVTPANLTSLIQKQTLLGGRRGRGRVYMPGVPEANTQPNGNLTVAYQGALAGSWNQFRLDMEASDLPLFLLHSDATTPTEIQLFSVDIRPATQRRRLRRS